MQSKWIVRSTSRFPEALRLFCFTYAGGAASAFRTWEKLLPPSIEVCPVELPGRGTRLAEPPYTRLPELVGAIAGAIPWDEGRPFAFFGHSMGALVCFELARELRRTYYTGPVHLFVSAHRAPQLPDPDPYTYTLSDCQLIEKLRSLEGTPQEVLDQPELLQLLLPRLRADFEVCDTYVYRPDAPMTCPITALGGTRDRIVSADDLEPWRRQTEGEFRLEVLPGGHFYLHTAQPLLLHLLAQTLRDSIASRQPRMSAA